MQDLGDLTHADIKVPVQELLYKLEIYDGAAWIDLSSLGSKNYLKSVSFNQGGAGVSPDPIAGTWSATVYNEDGIFHPLHPTSAYSSLLRVGRKVRISIGAAYGGTAHYFQRMIGYMDTPNFKAASRTIELIGMDSMKALAETELRSPDNYWGAMETFSSVQSTDVVGSELYSGADAVSVAGELDNMTNWTVLSHATVDSVEDDEGSGDLGGYNGEVTKTDTGFSTGWAARDNVAAVSIGKLYKVTFWYKRVTAGCTFSLRIFESGTATGLMGKSEELSSPTWASASFYFTATKSCNTRVTAVVSSSVASRVCRFDLVSIKEVTSYYNTRYNMPAACNGVYFVTLDGVPLWYGDSKQGWLYDPTLQVFYFDENTYISTGTNNLLVYYFTTQQIIDVLGDVLAATPLYEDRAAALAAMVYVDPLIAVPKVWFDDVSALESARRICELCNYRFWFDEFDIPHFLPASTHGDAVAWFSTKTCSDSGEFQDLKEIRNRIIIKGIEQGAFSTAKDRKTSRMICADTHDDDSIGAYLENTHPITNDLFQDQAAMDAMAATLLAQFKDPKIYSDLRVPKNPIPLQRGDTIEWDIELRPPTTQGGTDGLKNTVRGIIRDASFSGDGFNYKCEIRSMAMNVANYATGPVAVSAEHCKGWALTNSGASGDVHFDLPAATVGMQITFYVTASQTLTIDPNGTERIAVLTGTNGDYLRSDAVVGSCITLVCLVAGYWHCIAKTGTWAEE